MFRTPHRFLVDIYSEFVEDLTAAEVPVSEICKRQWFCYVWHGNPELLVAHITIASGKENFGRCTKCQESEERIGKARRGNDTLTTHRPYCAPSRTASIIYWKRGRTS